MRQDEYKLISTTAVVLSVAILSMGGNVYAEGKGGQQGIIIMNGVSNPPPAQRFYYGSKASKYQQGQTSGNTPTRTGMRCCGINEVLLCDPSPSCGGVMKYK